MWKYKYDISGNAWEEEFLTANVIDVKSQVCQFHNE
jgi:hypothetical protein